MDPSYSIHYTSQSENTFQKVHADIQAVKKTLKQVRESPLSTGKDFKAAIRVDIGNLYKREFDIGRGSFDGKWYGNALTTIPEWKQYWSDFLTAADLSLTAEQGKKLPIVEFNRTVKSDLPQDAL